MNNNIVNDHLVQWFSFGNEQIQILVKKTTKLMNIFKKMTNLFDGSIIFPSLVGLGRAVGLATIQ